MLPIRLISLIRPMLRISMTMISPHSTGDKWDTSLRDLP